MLSSSLRLKALHDPHSEFYFFKWYFQSKKSDLSVPLKNSGKYTQNKCVPHLMPETCLEIASACLSK